MNISDNQVTEALEVEVEKDISLLFPFIENEVNELALDSLRIAQMRQILVEANYADSVLNTAVALDQLLTKHEMDYQAALGKYIELHFDRKERELLAEGKDVFKNALEAKLADDREARKAEVSKALSAANFDSEAGYSYDDPKHPTWLDRMADAAAVRAKFQRHNRAGIKVQPLVPEAAPARTPKHSPSTEPDLFAGITP